MTQYSFRRALEEAGEAIERAPMPAAADRRLRERLAAPRMRRGVRWTIALAAAAAAAVVLLVWPQTQPETGVQTLGGMAVLKSTDDLDTRVTADEIEIRTGEAALADEAWGGSVIVRAPGTVRREAAGLRIVRGRVDVFVTQRAALERPVRVLVSHGVIDVVGTWFTVVQSADGGSVKLHEGVIRFVAPDGEASQLAPGQALAWPRPKPAPSAAPTPPRRPRAAAPPAEEEPDEVPGEPAATVPAPEPRQAAELLRHIDELRSRGRYSEAVRVIEGALRDRWRPATRERLSFELGSLLTFQMDDRRRACAHWSAHAALFGAGRYEREIAQARTELDCD